MPRFQAGLPKLLALKGRFCQNIFLETNFSVFKTRLKVIVSFGKLLSGHLPVAILL